MSEALESLLQELAGEGRFDSSDKFTLDWFRAQRSSQLFVRPCSFLLKLIQCAHLCDSQRLNIRRRGARLEVYFAAPKVTPAMLFQRSSLVLEQGNQSPLDPLVAAVRAAAQFSSTGIWWGVCGPELGLGYRLVDQEILVQPLGGNRTPEFECFFVVECEPPPWWRAWRGAWSSVLDEARPLCRLSSVLVEVDGKLWLPRQPASQEVLPWLCDRIVLARQPARELLTLPPLLEMQSVGYSLGTDKCRLFPLGRAQTFLQQWCGYQGGDPELFPRCALNPMVPDESYLRGDRPPGSLVVRTASDSISACLLKPPDTTMSDFSEALCARAWIRVPSRPQGQASRLTWVQHGVCLDSSPIELCLKDVEIFLADPDQPTDLAGFQAVKDVRWWQVQHWIQEELKPLPNLLYRLTRGLEPAMRIPRNWVRQVTHDQKLE